MAWPAALEEKSDGHDHAAGRTARAATSRRARRRPRCTAVAMTMSGRRDTGHAPRNVASRTALPATWCAIIRPATGIASRVGRCGAHGTPIQIFRTTAGVRGAAARTTAATTSAADGAATRPRRPPRVQSGVEHAASAAASAPALAGRSSGLLARQCITMRSRSRGIGSSVRDDGGSGCGLHVLERHAHRIGIVEHERAREQEVGDAAERVDVGAAVDRRFAHRHLRRDVARRARGRAFHRELRRQSSPRDELGQTEVEHLDEVVRQADLAEHHVRRLEVAVDQALLVRLLERLGRSPSESAARVRPAAGRTSSRASAG